MMLHSKKIFHASFTLVELMVSMAVFSLLLVMVMSFFSGAQKLVSGNGQNNDVYADARVAMDLMATMLNSTYYSGEASYVTSADGKITPLSQGSSEVGGFLFNRRGSVDSGTQEPSYELFFAVKPDRDSDFFAQDVNDSTSGSTSTSADKRDVYFVRIYRGNESKNHNKLYISYISPKEYGDKYCYLFPPYQESTWKEKLSSIITDMKASGNVKVQKIINNVVGLEFIFYKRTESSPGFEKYTDSESAYDESTPPYMLEIQLSLLTSNQMKEYNALSKDSDKKDYQLRNRRTFTRRIYFRDLGLVKETE